MKPQRLLLVLAILAIAGYLATREKRAETVAPAAISQPAAETEVVEPSVATTSAAASPAPEATPARQNAATAATPNPSPERPAPLNQVMPTVDDVRKNAAANPHAPNQSVVNFSIELATRLQDAMRSEQSADTFFSELETCTLGKANEGLHSIQSLCLTNATRLAKQYPSLEPRLTRLKRDTDPRTIELMNRIQQ